MGHYIVTEDRDSREFTSSFGSAVERRVYTVRIGEDNPSDINLNPTMITSVGSYPNVGGTPTRFTPRVNMKHPGGYDGYVYSDGTKGDRWLMRLETIKAAWLPNNVRAMKVRMVFRNVPDMTAPTWSLDSSMTSEETRTDIKGNPIKGPNGQSIALTRLKPQIVERATIRFLEFQEGFYEAVEALAGTTNKDSWRRHNAGHWLNIGATVDQVDDEHVNASYSFQLDKEKWSTHIQPLGEDGEPSGPPLVIPMQEQGLVPFTSLHGLIRDRAVREPGGR